MAFEGAIFDCDGTLLDSLPAWQGLEGYLCSLCDGRVTREDRALLTTFTIPETARWFHESFGLGKNVSQVVGLMDEYLVEQYACAQLLPGVAEFLEECARAGVKMSVASSSSPAYLESGLRASGIRDYFSAVYSVEQFGTTKREPHIYDRARETLGTPKQATWGFEDSQYAAETLKRAGYRVVGIYDPADVASCDMAIAGEHSPDVLVTNFSELAPERLISA
ncbi:MAG: HAD family hydrolase [Coriobacteriia bacterium]|nr:HAD family hydrolase [Coriobacteriia bacterium]